MNIEYEGENSPSMNPEEYKLFKQFQAEQQEKNRINNNHTDIEWEFLENRMLEQGTKEWLESRKSFLGGSLIPVIFNYCYPNETLEAHLIEKIFNISVIKRTPSNIASMSGGLSAEDSIRNGFELDKNATYKPTVFIGENNPLMASLDGYNDRNNEVLEIKACSKDIYAKIKDSNVIPVHFLLQIQAQLLATGAEKATCVCTNTVMGGYKNAIKVEVRPNKQLFKKIKQACTIVQNAITEIRDQNFEKGMVEQMLKAKSGKIGSLRKDIDKLDIECDSDVKNSIHYIPCGQTYKKNIISEDIVSILTRYNKTQEIRNATYTAHQEAKEECDLIRNHLVAEAGFFLDKWGVEKCSSKITNDFYIERTLTSYYSTDKMKAFIEEKAKEHGFTYREGDFINKSPKYAIRKTFVNKWIKFATGNTTPSYVKQQ